MASKTVHQFKQLFPASSTPTKLSAGISEMLKSYWGDRIVDDLITFVNYLDIHGSHLHHYNLQKGCIASFCVCLAVDFKQLEI